MTTSLQQEALRSLPAVHYLLQHRKIQPYLTKYAHSLITRFIQDTLAQLRIQYRQSEHPKILDEQAIVDRVIETIVTYDLLRLKPVINVTGIVLHTNLGRAVLSKQAVDAIHDVASGYSNLEYDLAKGTRGSRQTYAEHLLCQLTGAEAAMVVNNNAAAVWLVLRELAHQRNVIVSRGQLVEIGGSFRISEIMEHSGAHLVEVGTTNKTHLRDYQQAIDDDTAMLMKVHTSNFAFVGFHQEVPREELATLAVKHRLIFYEDLGSGMLYDLKQHGIGNEPTVKECVKAGVHLLSFSGDKLLGGPQAGLIVGRKQWIDRLKKNQLARAVRIDKLSLAALTSTLETYLSEERAVTEIPILRSIIMDEAKIKEKALQLARLIENDFGDKLDVSVQQTTAEVGGGALPGVALPSYAVCIQTKHHSIDQLERTLRHISQPIIGRVADDALWMDPRTLQPDELSKVVPLLGEAFEKLSN